MALERVYLRLGHSEDSAQLTSFCEKHLSFLLEKLGESVDSKPPDVSTRDKILDILTQLKKRLRSNPETLLPVKFLLEEYKKSSSALIKVNSSLENARFMPQFFLFLELLVSLLENWFYAVGRFDSSRIRIGITGSGGEQDVRSAIGVRSNLFFKILVGIRLNLFF